MVEKIPFLIIILIVIYLIGEHNVIIVNHRICSLIINTVLQYYRVLYASYGRRVRYKT